LLLEVPVTNAETLRDALAGEWIVVSVKVLLDKVSILPTAG
jgi:hypothetical protein